MNNIDWEGVCTYKIAGVFQCKEMLSFYKCPGPNDTFCFFQNKMYKIWTTNILGSITSHENGLNMQTQKDFAFTERHFTAHEWWFFSHGSSRRVLCSIAFWKESRHGRLQIVLISLQSVYMPYWSGPPFILSISEIHWECIFYLNGL